MYHIDRNDSKDYYIRFSGYAMSATECVVCAWRAACTLKFKYDSSESHCPEYTKDVTIGEREDEETDTESDKKKSTAE